MWSSCLLHFPHHSVKLPWDLQCKISSQAGSTQEAEAGYTRETMSQGGKNLPSWTQLWEWQREGVPLCRGHQSKGLFGGRFQCSKLVSVWHCRQIEIRSWVPIPLQTSLSVQFLLLWGNTMAKSNIPGPLGQKWHRLQRAGSTHINNYSRKCPPRLARKPIWWRHVLIAVPSTQMTPACVNVTKRKKKKT